MNHTADHTAKQVIGLSIPGTTRRVYGIRLRFDDRISVHYEAGVSITPLPDRNQFLFGIDRQQVYINHQAPSLLIDKLADDLGKTLYPLHVYTDSSGTLRGIQDMSVLKTRWQQQRRQLDQYYSGAMATQAIEAMEAVLTNEAVLMERLRSDWFFSLFFCGIYGLKPYDFRQPTALNLPLIPYAAPLKYLVTREITEQYTESKCLIIHCKGRLEEERSLEDILLKNPLPVYGVLHGDATRASGTADLRYRLYHEDFTVRSITGSCTLDKADGPAKKTDIEVYHLPDRDNTQSAHLNMPRAAKEKL